MPKNDHLNHKVDLPGRDCLEQLRQATIEFDAILERLVPPGREKSLAFTKLQECRMWAVTGVSMAYPVQEIGTGGELPENRG